MTASLRKIIVNTLSHLQYQTLWEPAAFPTANLCSGLLWLAALGAQDAERTARVKRTDPVHRPHSNMTPIKAMTQLIYKDVAHKMAGMTQPQPIWPLLAVL